MADGDTTELTEEQQELARERRARQDLAETLRKRDAKVRSLEDDHRTLKETVEQLQTRLDSQERSRVTDAAPSKVQYTGNEAEPDVELEPGKWLKWNQARQDLMRQQDRQNEAGQQMNAFWANSEQLARQQEQHYDDAVSYLKASYRDEVENTGELEEAAMRIIGLAGQDKTGQTRTEISRRMSDKGMTELEAAKDWAFDLAFESRKADTVRNQLRKGGNPALKQVETAKARGWKPGTTWRGAGLGLLDKNDRGSTRGMENDALGELERRKKLRQASETTADVRDGGEVTEKRAWTRGQLDELRVNNPAEYRRAINQIVQDSENDPNAHHGVVTR